MKNYKDDKFLSDEVKSHLNKMENFRKKIKSWTHEQVRDFLISIGMFDENGKILNRKNFKEIYNFKLNEDQIKKVEKWDKKYHKNCFSGAAGGRFTYLFTGTGLGTIIEVRCNNCTRKLDLTEDF